MQINHNATQPNGFKPMTVELTVETPDELRWLYHISNLQNQEISKAYRGNRLGNFEDRFQPFETPDKKPLMRLVKAHASEHGVTL